MMHFNSFLAMEGGWEFSKVEVPGGCMDKGEGWR